jgi:hypothetical protein
MKTIQLTKDKIALVDDEDYEYLNQWKWNAYKKTQKTLCRSQGLPKFLDCF